MKGQSRRRDGNAASGPDFPAELYTTCAHTATVGRVVASEDGEQGSFMMSLQRHLIPLLSVFARAVGQVHQDFSGLFRGSIKFNSSTDSLVSLPSLRLS